MSRRVLFLMPVLLFIAIAGYFLMALQSGRNPQEVPSVLVGKMAPEFALAPLLPQSPGLARADLNGGVVLVNFFASWCVPCRAEHPLLTRITQDLGVPIFGIAWKDRPEATRAYLQELGNPYARIGVDESGRTGIDFGITGVPESFIVGRDGRICSRQWGPVIDEAAEKSVADQVKACRG